MLIMTDLGNYKNIIFRLGGVRRQFQRHRAFADTRSWLTDALVRLRYRLPILPMPFFIADFPLRLKSMRQPIFFRANVSDRALITEIFVNGVYSKAIEIVPAKAKKILDLGGNIGVSVRLWQGYFPDADILAVEPDSGNISQLRKNIACGPAPAKVTVIRAFAAADAGESAIDQSSGNQLAYRMAKNITPGAELIPKRAVAELVSSFADSTGGIDLLKCDVEGAEAEIFRDCKNWIKQISAAIVETHHPYTPEALLADLRLAGAQINSHFILPNCDGIFVVLIRLERLMSPPGVPINA